MIAALSWPVAAKLTLLNAWCETKAEVHEQLKSKYAERIEAIGATTGGALAELWVGPNGWTWVVVQPSGLACVVATGDGWQPLKQGEGT